MKISAKWITSPRYEQAAVFTFRRDFVPSGPVKKAVFHASALGVYAFFLNGNRIGKGVLTPACTSYHNRVQYQTYDITELIAKKNRIELGLGEGWAIGHINNGDPKLFMTEGASVIAWLDVTYEDGSHEELITDEQWDVYTGKVRSSAIYHGETVDMCARSSHVGKAKVVKLKTKLVPQVGEWITEQERLAPIDVFRTPKNELIVDFGQNMTGYVELKIKAPRGSRIVMHHAEVLDKEGNFYTENYRSAKNENVYICSGEEDVFKPTYSFQGFRYIRLTEYPYDTVDRESLRAVVVCSDIKRTGHFVCGNEKINQLYHNIVWGQKSNYLDIPTDCPQRDERLGWTADVQVFCRTGAINYDVERFFDKWMGDVALEQSPEGGVKGVVPTVLKAGDTYYSAAWGDVACIVPWQMYLAYGNKKLLKKYYPVMKKWVGYMHGTGPEEYLWLAGSHFGDWLAMDAGEDSYRGATSNDLIASAFYAYSTKLVIKAGEVLGEDVTEYRELYKNVRAAFREYFMENGMPKEQFPCTETRKVPIDKMRRGMTQTAIVLILHFGLCEESERQALADKLVEMIRDNEMRMTTGFVGTPYILHALSENGYTDIAYKLLLQEKNPSWLYSVCHGATTMWEHWNSLKENGEFWNSHMNSFNHYAYGAVFDWMFSVACGISPVESAAGYREVRIAPEPDKCLGFANASIDTRNGTVAVNWYYKEDKVYYEITVPDGVTAHLALPFGYKAELGGGTYHFTE